MSWGCRESPGRWARPWSTQLNAHHNIAKLHHYSAAPIHPAQSSPPSANPSSAPPSRLFYRAEPFLPCEGLTRSPFSPGTHSLGNAMRCSLRRSLETHACLHGSSLCLLVAVPFLSFVFSAWLTNQLFS
ncbi:hypothetical protein E2C01_028886 [Portunus trituberculatus]|uniref:Uncharacterized protein n=1 Tax=Portunus trituberculatus TaxID=210409 RepID=A0A5B7ET35_PORTR|nr:hypothetical protein [Portunus trituberculatus]